MKHWLTIHTHLHSWIVHVVSILYIGHHLGCWCYSSKLFISMPSDILKCFPQVCPQTQTIRKQSVTILAFLSQWSLKSQGWPSPFFWNHHKESVFFINLFAGSFPQKKHEEKRASWFFIFQVSCCTILVCYPSQCTEDGCQGPWIKSEGLSRSKHASHASQMHHRFPCVTWTTSFRRIEHLASHNRSVLNHKINPKLTAAQGTSKILVYSEYILALV